MALALADARADIAAAGRPAMDETVAAVRSRGRKGAAIKVDLSDADAPDAAALRADEARSREILGRILAGRWGQPRDPVGAVVFLSAAASGYVHGIALPVDGGWLAR